MIEVKMQMPDLPEGCEYTGLGWRFCEVMEPTP